MVGYDQDDDQIWETYESAAIDSMSLALQQINVKWQLGQRTLRAMSFHFLKTSKDVALPLTLPLYFAISFFFVGWTWQIACCRHCDAFRSEPHAYSVSGWISGLQDLEY